MWSFIEFVVALLNKGSSCWNYEKTWIKTYGMKPDLCYVLCIYCQAGQWEQNLSCLPPPGFLTRLRNYYSRVNREFCPNWKDL